jgi:hypothetical protein
MSSSFIRINVEHNLAVDICLARVACLRASETFVELSSADWTSLLNIALNTVYAGGSDRKRRVSGF